MKPVLTSLFAGLLLAASSVAIANPAALMVSSPCAGCHGTNGASLGEAPVIAGLSSMYLNATMKNYRSGARYSTIMERIAKGYDDAQIAAMSDFFSKQAWPATDQKTDATLVAKGQQLHMTNGCIGCHGPTGISPLPNAPRMAGQYAGFLDQQMRDYRDSSKPIPPGAMIMRGMLSRLSDDDLNALAQFYASQK